MPITVQCLGCEKKLKANDELAGKRVKCPNCGRSVGIPGVGSAARPADTTNPPPKRDQETAASLPPPRRPVRWPWYAGGGAAATCILAVIVVFVLPGKDRTPRKNEFAAETQSEPRPEPAGDKPGPTGGESKPSGPGDGPTAGAEGPLPGAQGPKRVDLVKSTFFGRLSIRPRGNAGEEWLSAYPPDTTELFIHVVTDTQSNGYVMKPRKIEVRLRAPRGASEVGLGQPVTVETPSVGTVFIDTVYPCRAAGGPLPEGPYQAEVSIDGVRTFQLNWAVQAGAARPGKSVQLGEYEISDQRLKELAKDPDLTVLTLYNGGSNRGTVSAEGLRALAAAERLHTLSLGSLRLDESCLEALATLPRLRKLSINGSVALTDKSLAALAKIKTLKDLDLHCDHGYTPAELRELTALPELESLAIYSLSAHSLGGPREPVDDAGLKELAKIKTLRSLSLPYCRKITDDGLQVLAALKNLQFLSLSLDNSRVTQPGIDRLQKALPGLRFHRYDR